MPPLTRFNNNLLDLSCDSSSQVNDEYQTLLGSEDNLADPHTLRRPV